MRVPPTIASSILLGFFEGSARSEGVRVAMTVPLRLSNVL